MMMINSLRITIEKKSGREDIPVITACVKSLGETVTVYGVIWIQDLLEDCTNR